MTIDGLTLSDIEDFFSEFGNSNETSETIPMKPAPPISVTSGGGGFLDQIKV
jgi:hypothetical protein